MPYFTHFLSIRRNFSKNVHILLANRTGFGYTFLKGQLSKNIAAPRKE